MVKKNLPLIIILFIAGILRFYNLLYDSPYFFNPDERNMANAISQFRLPAKITAIPACLLSQFAPKKQLSTINSQLITNNCNLNPHFFAYGQFPLYLSFVSDQVFSVIPNLFRGDSRLSVRDNSLSTSFPSAIFWLRFWSALSSTFIVVFVYLITKAIISSQSTSIGNWKLEIGHYAAILAAFSPGLIQAAHFGTTESLLTFFFLASIYLSIKFLDPPKDNFVKKYVMLLSLTIGLALGSKLTGLFLFLPPAIAIFMRLGNIFSEIIGYCLPRRHATTTQGRRPWEWQVFYWGFIGLLVFIGSILIGLLSSPYNLVEPENFKSAVFGYEADVATGKYEAFYTRQFVNTVPILFQAEKVFPYALGWPIFVFGTLGFLLLGSQLLRYVLLFLRVIPKQNGYRTVTRQVQHDKISVIFLFVISFLIYLLPNAFLFAKWTRFMTPVLPFFSIFTGYAVYLISQSSPRLHSGQAKLKVQNYSVKPKSFKFLVLALTFAFCVLSLLPGTAFMSIYTQKDSRVAASRWIYENIPDNTYVLSETANVVDIPLGLPQLNTNTKNYKVISFDFYHMDQNPEIFEELLKSLEKSDYIFIPSRRIFLNYLRFPQKYPLVTKYYQLLFSGRLGFEKSIYISSYPQLNFAGRKIIFPDEKAEETWSVFDHPVIRIYKKVKPMTKNQYESLFRARTL